MRNEIKSVRLKYKGKPIVDIGYDLRYLTFNKVYTLTKIIISGSYHLYDDKNQTIWFVNKPNDKWYIWDYFYTEKELRKMKLAEIRKEKK